MLRNSSQWEDLHILPRMDLPAGIPLHPLCFGGQSELGYIDSFLAAHPKGQGLTLAWVVCNRPIFGVAVKQQMLILYQGNITLGNAAGQTVGASRAISTMVYFVQLRIHYPPYDTPHHPPLGEAPELPCRRRTFEVVYYRDSLPARLDQRRLRRGCHLCRYSSLEGQRHHWPFRSIDAAGGTSQRRCVPHTASPPASDCGTGLARE